jgi:predicted dehydrogenase/threonine dehydrogenase-like Zn-dependent dehydrogenase
VKQVLIRRGEAVVDEVPAPCVEPGTILVRVHTSCISIGTELSGLALSATTLWERAWRQPEKVKQVLRLAAGQGISATRDMVRGKLSAGEPTGYSAAGIVLEVGQGIGDLKPGDRVACAGAQYAHHAEVIRVPRNLVAPIPPGVGFEAASTVTLGAIALQGVRRAHPTLGESFVVVGLGGLGQLTVQLLRANGCRVIGTDLNPLRIRQAEALGLSVGLDPSSGDQEEQVARLTDGVGADGVLVTASSASDALISTAFRMCRKKGRVVLIGDVGLNLNRADIYAKELDFLVSSSYGPGRYDRAYEEEGLDYPVGYVRWTENRNMGEYLRLLAEGGVRADPLIEARYPVEEAPAAYDSLRADGIKPLMVVLSYPTASRDALPVRVTPNPTVHQRQGKIGVAIVGAGEFAKGVHLPNLKSLSKYYRMHAIVSRSGHNAVATARQFDAGYATTEYERVLEDPGVDLVVIATRHNLHASMALAALRRGKHVLVEKPLALTRDEVEEVRAFYVGRPEDTAAPILLTGFNRRFSPFMARVRESLRGRSNPLVITYRMNAGYVPLDHWVHRAEGGGRNLGEACHIYDLFTHLTESKVSSIQAQPLRPTTRYYSASDNFIATLGFADGSIATLTYTASGSREHPKEQMEVFADGRVVALDDYRRVTIAGAKGRNLSARRAGKGQKEELEALGRAILEGGEWPIPLWQQLQATEIALEVEGSLGGDPGRE